MRRLVPSCGQWSSLVLVALLLALCSLGCERNPQAASVPARAPTLRLYVISTLAGAIEPCGCVKDMLGGIDHGAGFIQSQANDAPNHLVIGAGPMLFMDPELDAKSRAQDLWKAEAIAESLRDMGLVAWAPGINDFAAGTAKLNELRETAGASLLAANLADKPTHVQAARVVEVGGLKVGLAGISAFERGTEQLTGVGAKDTRTALASAKQELDAQGARIRIALIAADRGEALRLAEVASGFQLVIVGKATDRGDGNDAAFAPTLVGQTLVVQAPNHLQAIGVIDLFVQGESFEFHDGSGIGNAERRTSLERRVAELEARINEWERADSGISQRDLSARRQDLVRLQRELTRFPTGALPVKGSFFRYRLVEVREKLADSAAVRARLDRYYRRVNEHNREAFKDLKPAPVSEGQSGYLGIAACAACHVQEQEFWRKTRHAQAYATLSTRHKQFNLECVSCHVTGYEKPAGTTVTHVAGLTDVQCEACHGPGSRHVSNPAKRELIIGKPARAPCAPACHHPPHVKPDWNVDQAWKRIIGPGHGM